MVVDEFRLSSLEPETIRFGTSRSLGGIKYCRVRFGRRRRMLERQESATRDVPLCEVFAKEFYPLTKSRKDEKTRRK